MLLNKNQMKAVRRMVMDVVKKAKGIGSLSPDLNIPGFQIDLVSVVVWALREMRYIALIKLSWSST